MLIGWKNQNQKTAQFSSDKAHGEQQQFLLPLWIRHPKIEELAVIVLPTMLLCTIWKQFLSKPLIPNPKNLYPLKGDI